MRGYDASDNWESIGAEEKDCDAEDELDDLPTCLLGEGVALCLHLSSDIRPHDAL
jgi:hypothetical protein